MKIAAYALMAIGVLLAIYSGYALWFARGDWLEVGLGALGILLAAVGLVLPRIAGQAVNG